MGGHDQSYLFSQLLKGRHYGYGTNVLAWISLNCHTHLPSVCWHSTTDGRITTWMLVLTLPMIPLRLMNF